MHVGLLGDLLPGRHRGVHTQLHGEQTPWQQCWVRFHGQIVRHHLSLGDHLGLPGGEHKQLGLGAHKLDLEFLAVHLSELEEGFQEEVQNLIHQE